MAQVFTVNRDDLKGWGTDAYKDWWVAVHRWSVENGVGDVQHIVGKQDGTYEITLDPALTEPEMSQFQTELDTLKSVDGTPGKYVFTHI